MNPISFQWKNQEYSNKKLGLSAQELLKIIPEVVKRYEWEKDDNGEYIKKELEKYGVFYTI